MSVHSRQARKQKTAQRSSSGVPNTQRHESIVDLTTFVVRSCVRMPDQVHVSYDQRQDRLIIEVAPKDRGLLIGRGGRTLRALEDVLSLAQLYNSGAHQADESSPINERVHIPLIELTTTRRDQSR